MTDEQCATGNMPRIHPPPMTALAAMSLRGRKARRMRRRMDEARAAAQTPPP